MTDVRAFRYRFPTDRLPIQGGKLDCREGILLQSIDRPNLWSEAAPLPGFSSESLSDVVDCLRSGRGPTPSSLAFAMSGLAPTEPTHATVPVNALLAGESQEVAQQAAQIAKAGFTSVKLKVGRNSLEDDIHLTMLVLDNLNPTQTLRLDANRAWNLLDAVRYASAINKTKIEYIEEPTRSPLDFEAFSSQTQIPYALDETLQNSAVELESFPNAAAFIAKPTLIGGLKRIGQLLKFNKRLVFSSAFESGIGVCQIARLASRFSPDVPAGLDTYRWLNRDVLADRWNMQDGQFSFSFPIQPDPQQLEEIPL